MYLCISLWDTGLSLYNYVPVEQLMPYLDSAEKYSSCTGSALATRSHGFQSKFYAEDQAELQQSRSHHTLWDHTTL